MSNRSEHLVVGAAAGGMAAFFAALARKRTPGLGEVIGGTLGGTFDARLPDILEPATHPNHRRFAQSVVFTATGATRPGLAALDWQEKCATQATGATDPFARFLNELAGGIGSGSVAGYVSHIGMDATTPKGIPLLGLR